MKNLFKSKNIYIITIIIMILIYSLLIISTKINYLINFEQSSFLICNIIIIILFLFLNLIFILSEKTNTFRKIILLVILVMSIFVPIKKNVIAYKVNSHTWQLHYNRPYNIIDVIVTNQGKKDNEQKTNNSTNETIKNQFNVTLNDD